MPKLHQSKSKEFSIRSYKSIEEIKSIVGRISNSMLTETSHDYKENRGKKIGETAKLTSSNYSAKAIQNPAMALAEVVLAANRNYIKVVEPYIKAAQIKYPSIKSFDSLIELMKRMDWEKFKEFWGHRDRKKYDTLKAILNKITLLRKTRPDIKDDYELMNNWATNTSLNKYEDDDIRKLDNIGVATFQHLRMVFGMNTVKPDQRVKEVLKDEFSIQKLNDINAIAAVEEIAKICGLGVLEVDNMFVNYGSGYYNKLGNRSDKKKDIAKRLKEKGVTDEIIVYATGLSPDELSKI